MNRRVPVPAPLGIAVGATAFVLAVAALLLAMNVRAVERDLERGDARFEVGSRAPVGWEASDGALARAARRILGVEDDLAFRDGARLFRLAHPETGAFAAQRLDASEFRTEAALVLQDAVRRDGEARRRSRATNLLGVLAFDESVADPQHAQTLLATAVQSFRRAIVLDPGNDDAKFNLELLQRFSGRSRSDIGSTRGGREGNPAGGAGFIRPGRGY